LSQFFVVKWETVKLDSGVGLCSFIPTSTAERRTLVYHDS